MTIFPILYFPDKGGGEIRHLLGNPRSSRRGTEVTHCAHSKRERAKSVCLVSRIKKAFPTFCKTLYYRIYVIVAVFSHYFIFIGGKTGHVLVFPKRTGSPVVRSNKEGRILHGASPTSFRSRGR